MDMEEERAAAERSMLRVKTGGVHVFASIPGEYSCRGGGQLSLLTQEIIILTLTYGGLSLQECCGRDT